MKRLHQLLYVIALFYLFAAQMRECSKLRDAPIVNTKYGSIQGVADSYASMYLGIPYAKPPINEYRWENTVENDPWTPNILQATSYKPACPQADCATRMPNATCPPALSEDCLYLNVFVPNSRNASKAVMVFIHGGNFQFQGANSALLDGRYITQYGDIILVTIEYRLGALGFLVTGDTPDQIGGNFGIHDQRMALKWVKENIANFGGDTSKITIFGQSAGGESTIIHYLSDDMQDKFNNVIVQSSPMAIPFRKFSEAMLLYSYFAEQLNCTFKDLKCLRTKTADEIVDSQMKVEAKISSLKLLEFFEPWLPWIDGKLIKANILEIEKWVPTSFNFKPLMMGTLTEECYIYIYLGFQKPVSASHYAEIMTAGFKQHALKLLSNYPPDFSKTDQRDIMATVATRWVFGCSSRNFFEKVINMTNGKAADQSYLYAFDFPLDFPGWGDNLAFCNTHVCHGSDIVYTFDSSDRNFTSTGRQISQSHMFYWSNFAKYSSPNAPQSAASSLNSNGFPNWPSYSMKTKPFLRFVRPSNTVESGYLRSECNFFDSIGYIF